MRLGGQRADLRQSLVGVERQIEIKLLVFRLQMQVEEEAADIDQRTQLGAEAGVEELLVAGHHGNGDRRAASQRSELRMHRRPAA